MGGLELAVTYNQNELSLDTLMNINLYEIKFTLTSVRFEFDGYITLSTTIWPIVKNSQKELTIFDAGYRNILCNLIGHKVIFTEDLPKKMLAIKFDNEISIKIQLDLPTEHYEVSLYSESKSQSLLKKIW